MRERDYYAVLGISREASEQEIHHAYRQAALKFHPDRNPGSRDAEQRFEEAAEAYRVLRDLEKRAAYDRDAHLRDFASAADHGRRAEAPRASQPPRPRQQDRPPEPPLTPRIHFDPPPPPPRQPVLRLVAEYGAFLTPVLLACLGLYLYASARNHSTRQSYWVSQPGSADAAMSPDAPPEDAAPVRTAPKKALRPIVPADAVPTLLADGTQLMAPQGPRGAGRFLIANRSGQDAVVRVALQSAPGTPLRLEYVQAGTEVPIEDIGTGVYAVSLSMGPLTSAPRKFGAPLGPFQFVQIEGTEGAQSDEYQLVLRPSP